MFSKRLLLLLENKGITQNRLAEELSVSRQTISSYMTGTMPPTKMIIKISEYFDVTTDYLLGRSDVSTKNSDIQSVCNYLHISEKAAYELSQFTGKKALNSKIISELLEMMYLQEFISMMIENNIASKHFSILEQNQQQSSQMQKFSKFAFQEFAYEMYEKMQNTVDVKYHLELDEELKQRKDDLQKSAVGILAHIYKILEDGETK